MLQLSKTIQHYFRKPGFDELSLQELQTAADTFPYAAGLQVLLLKKQLSQQHPRAEDRYNHAALFIPNEWRLALVLKDRTNDLSTQPVSRPQPIPESINRQEPGLTAAQTTVGTGAANNIAEETGDHAEAVPSQIEADSAVSKKDNPVSERDHPISAGTQSGSEEKHAVTAEPAFQLRTDILKSISPIPIPSLKDIEPRTDEMPVFEPYHTIDYFASQGIRLSNELPTDKLGKQLKSFTDWIKTMKKLPQGTLEKQLETTGSSENIQAMAADSVEMKEVVTETMAEVLAMQGNKAKAMELYHKLSLAYPDKSAYFAAQIEKLKHR